MDKIYRHCRNYVYENNGCTYKDIFERIYVSISEYRKYYEGQYINCSKKLSDCDLNDWIQYHPFTSDLKVEDVEGEDFLKKISYIEHNLLAKPKKYEDLYEYVETKKNFFSKKEIVKQLIPDSKKVTGFEVRWETENKEYYSSDVQVEQNTDYNSTVIRG